jgi:hypothetical protein
MREANIDDDGDDGDEFSVITYPSTIDSQACEQYWLGWIRCFVGNKKASKRVTVE